MGSGRRFTPARPHDGIVGDKHEGAAEKRVDHASAAIERLLKTCRGTRREEMAMATTAFTVEGMTCEHCVAGCLASCASCPASSTSPSMWHRAGSR